MEMFKDYATWRKSTRSGQSGNCVEAADLGKGIGVRDTKDRDMGHLEVSREDWAGFLASITK